MAVLRTLRIANQRRQTEWYGAGQSVSLAYRGNELAGEVGEACNLIKKLERAKVTAIGSTATVEQLADELADVLICVDLIAGAAGIDLTKALPRKFNRTSEKYNLQTRFEDGNAIY